MFRLSGAYLYKLGAAIRPLRELTHESKKGDVHSKVSSAIEQLDVLLSPETQEIIRVVNRREYYSMG